MKIKRLSTTLLLFIAVGIWYILGMQLPDNMVIFFIFGSVMVVFLYFFLSIFVLDHRIEKSRNKTNDLLKKTEREMTKESVELLHNKKALQELLELYEKSISKDFDLLIKAQEKIKQKYHLQFRHIERIATMKKLAMVLEERDKESGSTGSVWDNYQSVVDIMEKNNKK